MEPNVLGWCGQGLKDEFHVTVALQDLEKKKKKKIYHGFCYLNHYYQTSH